MEKSFSAIQRIRTAACSSAAPLLDRATQGLYPPGSTFKVVTAAAALDSGAYKPDSTFVDPGYCEEYGKRVSNAGNPETARRRSATVTLAQGLQHSINSVFCNIGKHIGAGKILDYAERFGFYATPDIELPAEAQSPSGLYNPKHKLFKPKHPEYQVDPGRLAFGQERLLVTPLQMAMVAATVANGGVLMQPHLIDKVRAPNGSILRRVRPHKVRRAISAQTAQELTQMMESVVTGGTATNVQIPGVQLAGKTGTAETECQREVRHVVHRVRAGRGAEGRRRGRAREPDRLRRDDGGPIAKALIEAILRQRSNTY